MLIRDKNELTRVNFFIPNLREHRVYIKLRYLFLFFRGWFFFIKEINFSNLHENVLNLLFGVVLDEVSIFAWFHEFYVEENWICLILVEGGCRISVSVRHRRIFVPYHR